MSSPDLSVYDRFTRRQALFATASLEEFSDQSRSFFTSGSRDEWTVLPFPGEEQDAFVLYGSSFVMLESDDVTQLATWLFMRWMLSSENQARWVQSTGLLPLRTSSVNLLADYSADHPQWQAAVEMLPEGQPSPRLASWRRHPQAKAVIFPAYLNGEVKRVYLRVSPSLNEFSARLTVDWFPSASTYQIWTFNLPSCTLKSFTGGLAVEKPIVDIRVCSVLSVGTVSVVAKGSASATAAKVLSESFDLGLKIAVQFLPELRFTLMELPNDLR